MEIGILENSCSVAWADWVSLMLSSFSDEIVVASVEESVGTFYLSGQQGCCKVTRVKGYSKC